MKKNLLALFAAVFLFTIRASAQTTGTFIVTDNGPHMTSCQDTLVTLEHIFEQTGILDLDDPADDISMYRILRLNGSLITSEELESFLFSAYPTVYVEKKDTPFNGHNGAVIYLSVVTPPTALFDTDTLKYVVERGAKQNYIEGFFEHTNLWSSNKDILPLQDRIVFSDLATGVELPISQVPSWGFAGKGTYRLRYSVSVCTSDDIFEDTLYVKIEESPCHNISIRDLPSVCRDQIFDILPYVYVDGLPATSAELADMTFWDRSNVFNQGTGLQLNPSAIDITPMWNDSTHYPMVELVYQPNVDEGTCARFIYTLATKVPTKFIVTDLIMTKDNNGGARTYTVDGTYYSFNDIFHKNVLEELYLNYYDVLDGTAFGYYTDNLYQNAVAGADLTPGDYYVLATNAGCNNDSTVFSIQIENRDFDISWMSAPNLGIGYHTFTAPIHTGASYTWFVWGGSIVAGLGTNQITVYYSENISQAVTVNCQIELPGARLASGNSILNSAHYFTKEADGTLNEINTGIPTGIRTRDSNHSLAYPNPTDGTFRIDGEGEMDLNVCNMLGQIVYEDKNYQAGTQVSIDAKGPHVVHVKQHGRQEMLKLMFK